MSRVSLALTSGHKAASLGWSLGEPRTVGPHPGAWCKGFLPTSQPHMEANSSHDLCVPDWTSHRASEGRMWQGLGGIWLWCSPLKVYS